MNRLVVFLLLAGIGGILLVGVYRGVSWLPSCTLYKHTGIHCPGCGLTRAVKALMRFDVVEAFRYNPVAVVLSPLLLYWFSMEIWYWLRREGREFVQLKAVYVKFIFVLVLCWFVARNVPHPSFNWARPTPDTLFDS